MSESRKIPNLPPTPPHGVPGTWVLDTTTGSYRECVVYDRRTGQAIPLAPVDAREAVANGSATWTPPTAGDGTPEAA